MVNSSLLHAQLPTGLVKRRGKQSDKNVTFCNAKIDLWTEYRAMNMYVYRNIIFGFDFRFTDGKIKNNTNKKDIQRSNHSIELVTI